LRVDGRFQTSKQVDGARTKFILDVFLFARGEGIKEGVSEASRAACEIATTYLLSDSDT